MRRTTAFLCLLLLLMAAPSVAQVSSSTKSKKTQQQDPNHDINEKLASQHFQNQDYEKAKELYLELYKKKGQTQHFNQYVECLIRLGEYESAEKELKKFIRSNPSSSKSKIDLMYIYTKNNQQDKANDLLDELLKGLPDNKNTINNINNMMRSRMLYDAALQVLEKGALHNTENYPFYLERATLFHSMNNYQQAFEYYFLDLEARPNQ